MRKWPRRRTGGGTRPVPRHLLGAGLEEEQLEALLIAEEREQQRLVKPEEAEVGAPRAGQDRRHASGNQFAGGFFLDVSRISRQRLPPQMSFGSRTIACRSPSSFKPSRLCSSAAIEARLELWYGSQ